MTEQLQELLENMKAKEIAAKQLKIQAIGKGDERSYDIYNISAELCGYFAEKLQEILQAQKPNSNTPPQLNKHDVIRSAIGDDKYNSLSRLIELHEMLNNGQGLDDEQYDEHEQLVSDLDNILPLH